MPTQKQLDNLKKGEKTQFRGENAARMGKKGNEAKAKRRAEKKAKEAEAKTFQELAKWVLQLTLYEGAGSDIESIKSIAEAKGENLTVEAGIILAQAIKGLNGDRGAAEFMRDTAGEKPVDRQDINVQTVDKSVAAMEAYFNDKRTDT